MNASCSNEVSDVYWRANVKRTLQTVALLNSINTIVYLYCAPVVILFGLVGDTLTIYILSQPVLRQSSVIYMYLTNLAITDLLLLLSLIPMVLHLGHVQVNN